MPRHKVVFAPLSNTFSHISDCLAVADTLEPEPYDSVFLSTPDKAPFIAQAGYRVEPTRELWQASGAQEVLSWFDDAALFRQAFEDELHALRTLQPHLVVGSYRFTTALTCRCLSIPYFSIIGPNMSPHFHQLLGIPPELVDDRTRASMHHVYQQKLTNIRQAFASWSFPDIAEIRHLLEGDRTFLHTFPDFEPLPHLPATYAYVGPLVWDGWHQETAAPCFERSECKHILVFLGSVISSITAVEKVLQALDRPDAETLLIAPQRDIAARCDGRSAARLHVRPKVDLDAVLPACDLAIVHGGLNVLHYCLKHGTPCLIVPYQVEQAQNALQAERLGFGRNVLGAGLRGEVEHTSVRSIVQRVKVFLRYHDEIRRATLHGISAAVEAALADRAWRARCQDIARAWQGQFTRYRGAFEVKRAIQAYCPPGSP
jgi:UDP:flavonoid glycosyltransferase YjiC (YdhE family)